MFLDRRLRKKETTAGDVLRKGEKRLQERQEPDMSRNDYAAWVKENERRVRERQDYEQRYEDKKIYVFMQNIFTAEVFIRDVFITDVFIKDVFDMYL